MLKMELVGITCCTRGDVSKSPGDKLEMLAFALPNLRYLPTHVRLCFCPLSVHHHHCSCSLTIRNSSSFNPAVMKQAQFMQHLKESTLQKSPEKIRGTEVISSCCSQHLHLPTGLVPSERQTCFIFSG